MTNREIVIEVLKNYSCLTSFQIKGFARRMLNEDITPQSASGVLRTLCAYGYAGRSPDTNGKMVYWLTDYGKKVLLK